jgi:uncharacterized protein with ParB-like and HNH nuclease domain
MISGFEKPITIQQAIKHIDKREYLLPALQRQFVWSTVQIEILFDSIMRDYPINSFMLWRVTDSSIKNNFKFYEFLKKYRERYNELNPEFETKGYEDFYAVIDGQQRLTSIYIGLKGSYAYKEYKKWWINDETNLPTRFLYLDISNPIHEDNERKVQYDFRFLREKDIVWHAEHDSNKLWFKVGDILTIGDRNALDNFIEENGWLGDIFKKGTLRKLWTIVHERPLINYYLENSQDLSTVLDIFIRTNSGGEPLSFSDLLMSLITASWKNLDARKEIPDVINQVFAIRGREFHITKDFVLKTCLVLLNDNVKFQIKNFDEANIVNFEEHWLEIKKAIITSFELVANLGLTNFTLRAKNAVIPIIYFIYHKKLVGEINHPLKHNHVRALIHKWLLISLLKGVFGGQSDSVLTKIRKIMSLKLNDPKFPFQDIVDEFASDPSKNLTFDSAFVDEILKTQYEDPQAHLILSLLYPNLDYFNQDTHKDHLYSANLFRNLDKYISIIPESDIDFYKDPQNWNSILNLQMLNGSLNSSKKDKHLKVWIEENEIDLISHIIPSHIRLEVSNFREFIEVRKLLLIKRITEIVA